MWNTSAQAGGGGEPDTVVQSAGWESRSEKRSEGTENSKCLIDAGSVSVLADQFANRGISCRVMAEQLLFL